MDLTEGLKNEIVRPVLTLVVPGAVGLFPIAVQIRRLFPALTRYLERHPSLGAVLLFLAILSVGLVFQSLGSWIEAGIIDAQIRRRYSKFESDWYNYLRLPHEAEQIGHRYLRSIMLHMKFELAMIPALVVALIGINWFNSDIHRFDRGSIWAISITLVVLMIYFFFEARSSVKVLARVRYALLSPPGASIPSELS
jgi:hypothetical protein